MISMIRLLTKHFWGVVLLVVLLIGSGVTVRAWKSNHPGSMSVLESQAMDMTVMKPPVGAVPVATEVVHLGQFTSKVAYTGSVAPLQEQVIYPRVAGWLKNFNLYNGDRVGRDQLIATVDSPDLQSKVAEASAGRAAAASEVPKAHFAVTQMTAQKAAAEGEVQAAKGELARAKAMLTASQKAVIQREKDITSAKADLDYWRAQIKREKYLLDEGAISLQEYQSEQAKTVTAQAGYENKQAMLEEAKADVQAFQADIASKQSMVGVANQRVSAAAAALSGASADVQQKAAMYREAAAKVATASTIDQYRYVRAPFAGSVTKRISSPGQYVTPSTPIIDVVQIDQVRLQANVSDKDLAAIKVGAPVAAHFDKDPKLMINAVVTSVSPLADQSSRTATVEALVSNPGHKLVPGDAVTMDIAVSGSADVISIPASAIVQKDGMPGVWIARAEDHRGKTIYYCTMHPEVTSDKPGKCYKCNMDLVPKTSSGNKKAHLLMVTTGPSDGDRVEIVSGLTDGDEVIYQGNTYLREGDTVFSTKWTVDGPEKMPNAPGTGSMPGMKDMPGMDHSKMKTEPPSPTKVTSGQKVYVCPMHPHEMSHKPGNCKICGMKLVERK